MSHEDDMKCLRERFKRARLCRCPDKDEPHLLCGHPLPCPYHTLVLTEEQAFELLEDLERSEGEGDDED